MHCIIICSYAYSILFLYCWLPKNMSVASPSYSWAGLVSEDWLPGRDNGVHSPFFTQVRSRSNRLTTQSTGDYVDFWFERECKHVNIYLHTTTLLCLSVVKVSFFIFSYLWTTHIWGQWQCCPRMGMEERSAWPSSWYQSRKVLQVYYTKIDRWHWTHQQLLAWLWYIREKKN